MGPFTVSANVEGSSTGLVAQHHVLREALMAERPPPGFVSQMIPSTVVSVRLEQTAKVTFDGIRGRYDVTRQVVCHVWNLEGNYGKALQAVPEQCVAAFQDPKPPIQPALKGVLAEFVSAGPCDGIRQPVRQERDHKGGELQQATAAEAGQDMRCLGTAAK